MVTVGEVLNDLPRTRGRALLEAKVEEAPILERLAIEDCRHLPPRKQVAIVEQAIEEGIGDWIKGAFTSVRDFGRKLWHGKKGAEAVKALDEVKAVQGAIKKLVAKMNDDNQTLIRCREFAPAKARLDKNKRLLSILRNDLRQAQSVYQRKKKEAEAEASSRRSRQHNFGTDFGTSTGISASADPNIAAANRLIRRWQDGRRASLSESSGRRLSKLDSLSPQQGRKMLRWLESKTPDESVWPKILARIAKEL